MATPRFPLLLVDAAAPRAEELGVLLFELGAEGLEVRDETTLVSGPGPGQVRLVASFATDGGAEQASQALARHEPGLTCRLDELVGDEWRDKYKEHFTAFELTPSVMVVPPWEEPAVPEGMHQLVLDPGRAFGTGLHATTALVAGELEDRQAAFAGEPVLDVGTGSGILALMALRLGAASARAIDCDDEAIAVATENAERNGLLAKMTLECRPLERIKGQFAAVLANIEARVLEPMAGQLISRVRPGGILLLSGVLAGEHDEILAAYGEAAQRLGLPIDHRRTVSRGDGPDAWVALAFRRGQP